MYTVHIVDDGWTQVENKKSKKEKKTIKEEKHEPVMNKSEESSSLTAENLLQHDKRFEVQNIVLTNSHVETSSWADDADDEEHSLLNKGEYVYQVSTPEWAQYTINKKRKNAGMSICSDDEEDGHETVLVMTSSPINQEQTIIKSENVAIERPKKKEKIRDNKKDNKKNNPKSGLTEQLVVQIEYF